MCLSEIFFHIFAAQKLELVLDRDKLFTSSGALVQQVDEDQSPFRILPQSASDVEGSEARDHEKGGVSEATTGHGGAAFSGGSHGGEERAYRRGKRSGKPREGW